ncbi:hypothetical protein F7P69_13180 [Cellulosimicrobium funkei]|nr:hypothetical protein [Cellulosimicrobium funkei]
MSIPLAGADQTLYWAAGARYEGIVPEISLRHVATADPAELMAGADSEGWLPLGVEPWVAGSWRGVHAAWSLSRYASTVIRRHWILEGGPQGLVEVVAQHNAYLSRFLAPVLNGLVAGITPAPETVSDLASDLDRAVAAADRVRKALADRPRKGLVRPTTLSPVDRDRIVAEFGAESGWTIMSGVDSSADQGPAHRGAARRIGHVWTSGSECLIERTAEGGEDGVGHAHQDRVHVGRYTRDDAADMVLRTVGHRPEGPSDVPVSHFSAEAFTARLHDRTVPLPPEIPDGAVVSSHLDPQDIYRWWTADWSWWSLHRETEQGHPAEGIRVLTVAGFGHYVWDGGGAIRLQPVDGLALYTMVTVLLGRDEQP